ncbi:MAG: C4-dicarboxylate ABC transporter permease [Betaproteobacteria bacterium RIFCSPLOWO2_12_FULL_64_23]|nr:MAG: C4-dicarboxylate ABC transporter permease [Betaproteobacteria bacterium RIFCSPLOWO2_12_FULL_64_23]
MNEHPDPIKPAAEEPPRIPVKIEEFLAAMSMALICLITFANVLVRYLTDESFAFTEEFSVFLMVVLTFVGASAAFAKNSHVRMSFVVERLPPRLARHVEIAVMVAAAVLLAILVWYGIRLLLDDWNFDTTSPGIGIPQWIYTLWLPLLSAVIALRIVGRIVRLARRKA